MNFIAESGFVKLRIGSQGHLYIFPLPALQAEMRADEYQYSEELMEEVFDEVGYDLDLVARDHTHYYPIISQQSDPSQRWIYRNQPTQPMQAMLEAGQVVVFAPYHGEDIEVQGQSVYYVCGCGHKTPLAGTAYMLLRGVIEHRNECEDCGKKFFIHIPPIRFGTFPS